MRVERSFSPKKIIIESEEDKKFILTMIQMALIQEDRAWISKDSIFRNKLINLHKEIEL